MVGPSDVAAGLLAVVRAADDHDVKYPAAALAYYAFVSLLPLLVLVVAVVGEGFTVELRSAIPNFLTPEAQALVGASLTSATGRTGATVLAVGVLAWSLANVAMDFQTVVERVEQTPAGSLGEQLRDAVAILGSLLLVVAALLVTGAAFTLVPQIPVVERGWPLLVLVVLTLAFLPLYALPSRLVTSLGGALPGAFTAALGWTALLVGIQFYAENAGQYAIYGVLSGVIIILTSLYLGALALMVGVIVNAVVADAEGAGLATET